MAEPERQRRSDVDVDPAMPSCNDMEAADELDLRSDPGQLEAQDTAGRRHVRIASDDGSSYYPASEPAGRPARRAFHRAFEPLLLSDAATASISTSTFQSADRSGSDANGVDSGAARSRHRRGRPPGPHGARRHRARSAGAVPRPSTLRHTTHAALPAAAAGAGAIPKTASKANVRDAAKPAKILQLSEAFLTKHSAAVQWQQFAKAPLGALKLGPTHVRQRSGPMPAALKSPDGAAAGAAAARGAGFAAPSKRAAARADPVVPQPGKSAKDIKDIKQAVQRWYKVDAHGNTAIVSAGKYELIEELGVHARDLRILDGSVTSSYPSCILAREHALVVNLEYVQVVVTTDTTIVLNADNDKVRPFVAELQQRLSPTIGGDEGCDKRQAAIDRLDADPAQELSYELKVLEVCLDTIAKYMEALVADLEASAYPALDALTKSVSASNLERVRRVKNRMVRLNTRVETIRELLEKYLDDDEDMEDLNLSGKEELAKRELERVRARLDKRAADLAKFEAKQAKQLEDGGASMTSFSSSSASSSEEDKGWLSEQVEMVLEPYFMYFDNTWNRIQIVGEYVDDTEDLVNTNLDIRRNYLIRIDLTLMAAFFCVSAANAVSGLFGMNILPPDGQSSFIAAKNNSKFRITSSITCAVAILIFATFVRVLKWRRLAF